ncbi:hypothetical protein MLD38_027652 [Melastoma candidum]|uniref:Uncharacterized protein n=1 Tax=Melastoma candidum TaxID=119954 RepID=A0ACB9P5C0_9MYRT|nr:hypothetical protein MLD38_027652 [Melastoma candidum]
MCSTYFLQGSFMDRYYHQGQGDLTDILRPPATRVPSDARQRGLPATTEDPNLGWGLGEEHDVPTIHGEGFEDYDFRDPFSNMKDPLLHELELVIPGGSSFLGSLVSDGSAVNHADDGGGDLGCNSGTYPISMLYAPPMPSLSHQQDPSTSVNVMPFELLECPLSHEEATNPNLRSRLTDTAAAMQISAQNSSMKRRKGQAKKVVCIPAPASAANGRAGGVVVPSDLWAWRKYGQKPIKGSPYPRGYYRCSSSKGCSARKQVERSRMDPNMLVITYTSEHNHPWPTQRNALAGSTRATQSSNKNNGGNNLVPKASSSPSPSKDPQRRDKRPNDAVLTNEVVPGGGLGAYLKEEIEGANDERSEEDGIMGLDRGRCTDEDDFLFRDLEGMDGGSDPFGFLLDQGGPNENGRPKDGSDSFGGFFDCRIDFDWYKRDRR